MKIIKKELFDKTRRIIPFFQFYGAEDEFRENIYLSCQ